MFFKIYGYAVHDYTLPAIGYVHRTLIRDTLYNGLFQLPRTLRLTTKTLLRINS